MKTVNQIRQDFFDFFEEKGHKVVPSAPVVPSDDPTLLFINAGMNQFKNIFLGTESPKVPRIVDTQKCIRVSGKHNDLEDVGLDTYHHTFFEMLGNWSFGDYYKKEAIEWAWELLTDVWGFEKERLWATVHDSDDESEKLWPEVTELPAERVLRFGDKENFWEMGNTGPCGPCSEIHYYIGDDVEGQSADKINSGDAEYIELWNLVFIQYFRDSEGKLNDLPKKHVDTGLGLERLTAVVQGKSSNYDTDIFSPIIKEIEKISGKKYEGEDQNAFRVIADHLRSLAFSIADGVMPSNEGRGYVIRRLLRRAAKFGRNLDLKTPFIYKLVSTLADLMGDTFPELRERKEHIERIIKSEEESFGETIDRGLELFEQLTDKMKKSSSKQISGEDSFKLYDTFGFPIDLTSLMAKEKGLSVDLKGFEKKMTEQKERSRQKKKFVSGDLVPEGVEIKEEPTLFSGYDMLEVETEITQIIFHADKDIRLLLKETPYYAESGGQVGDIGFIFADGMKIRIDDTQKVGGLHYVHIGEVLDGDPKPNMKVKAEVNPEWRKNILPNHTATHLMHAALRGELGDHVEQAGSLVAPDRLRFDYHHSEKPTLEQLKNIEIAVNEKIRENIKLKTTLTTFENAKKSGAMALFGEKYGDEVRMVEISVFSKELCGGTHVERTGDIGLFLITHESSVSSGVRRIEAVTGERALRYVQENRSVLSELENRLSVKSEQLPDRIKALAESNKDLERKLKKSKLSGNIDIDSWIDPNNKTGDVTLVTRRLEASSLDEMKEVADRLREKLKSGVGVFASEIDNKANIVVIVTPDIIKSKNITATELIAGLIEIIGGGGGGSDRIATAGGGKPELIEKALSQSSLILSKLTK